MTTEEVKKILKTHKKREKFVNLSGMDLSHTDLRGTNLSGANLHGTNLSNVDLSNSNLSGANLSNTDLSNTDLSNVDLSDANISDADLRGANLNNADLNGANLYNTNLYNTNLRGIKGNLYHVKSLQIEKYNIAYTSNVIQIECKRYTIEEWKTFSDKEIRAMDNGALEWWGKWKHIIMQIIELSPCMETKYKVK